MAKVRLRKQPGYGITQLIYHSHYRHVKKRWWLGCVIPALGELTQPSLACTVCGHRMAYRKWKQTNVQPGTAGPGNMLSCGPSYVRRLYSHILAKLSVPVGLFSCTE